MARTAVRARRVITPAGERPATVLIEGAHIEAVLDYDAQVGTGTEVVRIEDDCAVLPGLVDSHVHVNEPGRTAWEGFRTATMAAAAGGITCLVDMPLNSIPATLDLASLAVKQARASGRCYVDVGFWAGAVPGNEAQFAELLDAGVAGFKCFLAPSGVPEFPELSGEELGVAMRRIVALGGLLIAHAEDPRLLQEATGPRYAGFLASRPTAAELSAVQLLIEQVRQSGCATHVVHVSSAAAMQAIQAAKADGLPVTAETCPHYLLLRADEIPDGSTVFKCCPPIRDAANQRQLWQGLLDGVLDCVVSDHSPCSIEDKQLATGDFGTAWGGIAGLQLSLPVTWTAASEHGASLAELARWMSSAPAALVGFPDRGAIVAGRRADLCVLAPEEEFLVQEALLLHRNPASPYTGRRLRGVVRQTWLAGRPLELSQPPRGELLRSVRP
ncbi:MAG: allantoinase AllB [Actinomycetota bacterium]|nr:allantoinase AllB [Actinomycetota bacterium]MDQ2956418.1 allantoinase AllB [Actinomycetota bacterium]